MADKQAKEEPEEDGPESQSGKKKGVVLGGGIVGLVAAAYLMFLVAVPSSEGNPPFDGPFLLELTAEPLQVNLAGDGGKHYLVMTLKARYEAYSESYATSAAIDPIFVATEKHALISATRHKTKAELDDQVGEEVFLNEIRDIINPLLFPIHFGGNPEPDQGDEASGLRPGHSVNQSTMRGGYMAHVVHLDSNAKTIALDNGPTVQFEGHEVDLLLESEFGLTLHVDVSHLNDGFQGDVSVGTHGRIVKILYDKFIVQ